MQRAVGATRPAAIADMERAGSVHVAGFKEAGLCITGPFERVAVAGTVSGSRVRISTGKFPTLAQALVWAAAAVYILNLPRDSLMIAPH